LSRVLDAIKARAIHAPSQIALSDPERMLTYRDLVSEVDGAATKLAALACLKRPGAPVAITLPNSLDWVVIDLALIKLGWPSLPIPGFFTPEQRRHALADASAGLTVERGDGPATLMIAGQSIRLSVLADSPPRLHAGTAKVTYTSGSTGQPKGVCLSQAQMEDVASSLVKVIGADYAGVHLPILPLAILLENVAGLYATLLAGGRYHIESAAALGLGEPFKPDFRTLLETIARSGATSLILVPELLRALTMTMGFTGVRLPKLTMVAVGGAKVATQILSQAEAMGLPVYEGYGLSECASVVALNTPNARLVGAAGRPLPHLRVDVDAEGEVIVGPRSFLGYAGQTAHPGPVRTGDLGRLDSDGFLHIDGRRGSRIITAFGRNVAPEWVESELLAQVVIQHAVVFGEAQAELGAILVPLSPAFDAEAISQAVSRANQNLPDYAKVRRWLVRPPFDRNAGELTGNGRPRRSAILARHRDFIDIPSIDIPSQDPPMTFFQQLIFETVQGQEALAAVPQIQDGLMGRISLPTYIAYLTEAYHHVKHTVPLMQAAKARLGESQARFHAALDDYITEETGHEAWILDDIRNAGGDAEAVRAGTPREATRRMVDFAYDYIAHRNPMGFFGMVLVLEGTSVRLATQGADAVAKNLRLGPECFRYLSSHGAVDQQHMAFFQGLMDQVDDPEDQAAIIEVAKAVFVRFADLFRAIPHDRSLAHVA
jgi:long-subunit acyl-CoA synthetase (AMP-forming)